MVRRRRSDSPPPDATVPTVWAAWQPLPNGPALGTLRRYFELMDQVAAGDDIAPTMLAGQMYSVYQAATDERLNAANRGGSAV